MKYQTVKLKTIFALGLFINLLFISPLFAQTTKSANPNDKGFRLAICDGPAALNTPATHMMSDGKGGLRVDPQWKADPNFIPCDFQGLMKQVQWLITAMLTLGVFVAILGFSYAGFLYVRGTPGTITQAHKIFEKVGVGFVIMLSAWFIIYQVLGWLTGNSGLKALLGSP
jgi:hypothetical protein